jgi:two-component system LytT family response regulator
MIRVIIVEDEPLPRQMLREKLEQNFPDIEIVGECGSAETGLIEVLRLRPDLLLLDIQMPGNNGLWLVDQLVLLAGETFTPPEVIFTTGYTYSEYLVKAFEVAAIDYLVKPVSVESLTKAIERYRRRAGTVSGLQGLAEAVEDERLLKFKSYNGLFLFRPEDIVYVEADRDYACMFLAGGAKEDVFERLGEIERRLPADTFIRAGKSVVVNRRYIRKITDSAIRLVTPTASYTVEISRNAIKQLKQAVV